VTLTHGSIAWLSYISPTQLITAVHRSIQYRVSQKLTPRPPPE